jgi:hypothetical protein
MPTAQKPTCFVISPIGPNESDIRKRADKVLKHIFKKALADKYDVIRADDMDEPGMITSQVLRAVQEAPLVVADLTGHNPNVLYELAVRHAIEKPIIHAIEPKLSKIPFDIAGFRTIEFDLTDPDSIESAVEQLKKQTQQAENGKWGETPVKLANIMSRSNADSPDTVLLKQAVQGIAALNANVSQLSSRVGEQLSNPQLAPGTRYYGTVVPPNAGNFVSLSGLANVPSVDGLYGLNQPGALSLALPAAHTLLNKTTQPNDAGTTQRKYVVPTRRRRRPLSPRGERGRPEK